MNHTERFEEFRNRREAQRRRTAKVTWRRVSEDTGGGLSGLGPGGQLVWCRKDSKDYWPYGKVEAGKRVQLGWARSRVEAKRKAEELLKA